jgi:hypothetical protein
MRKVKNVLLVILLLSAISCTDKGIILETADNYTKEKILPLFQNAQITNRVPFIEDSWKVVEGNDRITSFKKSHIEKVNYLNSVESIFLDKKERESKYIRDYNEEEFKLSLLENAIESDVIKAIKEADSSEGFYIVNTAIKYGNNKYDEFAIILSKDLKILNTPIDTAKLYRDLNDIYF